jgi:hypothetical protein
VKILALIFWLISSPAWAFLPLLGSGSSVTPEVCDCTENLVNDGSTTNGIYTTGTFYAQSFATAGSGTNVVVTLRAGTIEGDSGTSAYTITIDDDWNLADAPLGSASGTLAYNADNTNFCTVVTTTAITPGTYYFSVSTASATYSRRFYLRESQGSDYASGKLMLEDATTGLDFSSGTESDTDDLYFSVCVGAGCSCD